MNERDKKETNMSRQPGSALLKTYSIKNGNLRVMLCGTNWQNGGDKRNKKKWKKKSYAIVSG